MTRKYDLLSTCRRGASHLLPGPTTITGVVMRLILINSLILLAATVAGVYSRARAGESVPTVDSQSPSTLVLDGMVGGGNVVPLARKLLELAGTVVRDSDGKATVDLIISSPGGEVETGFLLISAMEEAKARGLTLRCYVPTLAASMAFSILNHCSRGERYALTHSFLLWHRVRVHLGGGFLSSGVSLTGPDARDLAEDLEKTDRLILRETTESLGIDPRVVLHHFNLQTLHIGSDLGALAPDYIRVVDVLPGVLEALASPRTTHLPQGNVRRGALIYLYEGRIPGVSQ